MIDLEEEGLLISFEESGPVDMPWHMAKWGREIEVVEPAGLRKMVEGVGLAPNSLSPQLIEIIDMDLCA